MIGLPEILIVVFLAISSWFAEFSGGWVQGDNNEASKAAAKARTRKAKERKAAQRKADSFGKA